MAPSSPASPKGGGKKIMGLPVYVWVGALAAGLLLGLYLRSRGSSSGSTAAASPAVDTSSTPTSIDSGLSGQSVGLNGSTATVDNGMSDLLNSLAVQSQDTEALTAQLASLVSLPVAQVASSGGSGAGHGHKKPKPHKMTPHHRKQHKAESKKNKKVTA